MNGYRKRIYEQYVTVFKKTNSTFNQKLAKRWGLPYDYYFRRWLNSNKKISILDLACGDGKLLFFFITRGYSNIKGVDISPQQVKIAQQICPDVLEANIMDFLDKNSGAFDLITGTDIIEHMHKNEVLDFMDKCFSCLKPNGRLILQTPNADSPMSSSIHHGDFTHEVLFNVNSLSSLMNLCGFINVEAREQGPVPWGYGYKSSFRFVIWKFIRSFIKVWNLAETGGAGSGVFTRVFLISGTKP